MDMFSRQLSTTVLQQEFGMHQLFVPYRSFIESMFALSLPVTAPSRYPHLASPKVPTDIG
jgi:hypothetical protein